MKRVVAVVGWLLAPLVLSMPASAQQAVTAQADSAGQGVSFDFIETDIRTVLAALAEAAGFNIVFGSLPARPITLRTPRPVALRDIPPLMRSIAETNGLRIIEEGSLMRVAGAEQERPLQLPQQVRQQSPQEDDIYVYRLRHVPAGRVAAALQGLLGATISASAAAAQRTTLTDQLRSQRIPPGYPEAAMPPTSPDPRGGGGGTLHIIAEESTNSLLVRASAAEWQRVQRAIQLIDVRPLQVLIEVLIVEVRRSRGFGFGTELAVPEQDLRGRGLAHGGLESQSAGDFALSVLALGTVRMDVAVRALSTRADVSIISRPVILAQNNAEARILVGSQRPFIQVVRALPTDGAARDQVIQYRDVGTSLRILPTINPDGYINMDLIQEISTATAELQFGAPVISTREASTTLLVRDGHTAVIGGLIDRQQDHSRSGVPILKDIPLIGMLFSSRRSDRSATELFMFLTPHVIRTDDDAQRIRRDIELNTEFLRKAIPRIPPLISDTSRIIIPPPDR